MIDPEGHRLVVKVDEPKECTASGIWKPAQAVDNERMGGETGVVIAKGPTAGNCFDKAGMMTEVGDRIAFNKYAGKNFIDPEDDKEYRILNDEDVLAVIRPGKNEEI